MAVAFDAASESVRTLTTSPWTFTHTGRLDVSGGVQGVLVACIHGTSSTDHVSAVSYGGVALTRVQRNTDTATEPGAAEWWFVGSGLSGKGGLQTVSVTCGATTDDFHFVVITLTGLSNLRILDNDGVSENAANPSVTLQSSGRVMLSFGALYGGGAAPSSFTPNAFCETIHDHDLGAFYSEVIMQSVVSNGDFDIGGTASSDDVAYAAVAVTEMAVVMAADAGAVPMAEASATLLAARMVGGNSGAVPIVGSDVDLIYGFSGYTLPADTGAIVIAGANATLLYSRLLGAESGEVPMSGQDAGVLRGYPLIAGAGSIAIKTKRHPAIVPDSSGNQRHGVIKGTPTEIDSPWSGFGTTLAFDGVDADDSSDGVEGPTMPAPTALTFECRFKCEANRSEVIASFWDWGADGNTYSGIIFYLLDSDSFLHCDIYNQYTGSSGSVTQIGDVGNVTIGEHTCAVEISGGGVALYLDGVDLAHRSATWPSFQGVVSAGRINMGRNPPLGLDPLPFQGVVDEVRLSNVERYGFASYTPASSPFTPDANTLLLWHFDESETAADLKVARLAAADAGAVPVSGLSAGLLANRLLDAAPSGVPLLGQDAALLRGLLVDAAAGATPIDGQAVGLLFGRLLAADSGQVAISGADVGLLAGWLLSAVPGAVPILGQDATLVYAPSGGSNYLLDASAGAVPIVGADAALLRALAILGAAGSVSITGQDAALIRAILLGADAGAIQVSGQDAALLRGLLMSAEAGPTLIGAPQIVFRLSMKELAVRIGQSDSLSLVEGRPVMRVGKSESGAAIANDQANVKVTND